MTTKRAVPKAVHSIAQLARAVHGLESNPWRRILQQKGGHGRASHVVDGRRHDRVLRRRLPHEYPSPASADRREPKKNRRFCTSKTHFLRENDTHTATAKGPIGAHSQPNFYSL